MGLSLLLAVRFMLLQRTRFDKVHELDGRAAVIWYCCVKITNGYENLTATGIPGVDRRILQQASC